ncbi:MAG: CHASE3 domain-containing protein, partial [Actinomycetota bacterium]|nr:CHASE3 domain-containing protein [Actinomycetota bacterium]
MRAGLIRRMVVASGLLALIVGAAFAVLFVAIDELRGSAQRARHAREELTVADELQKLVIDLETGVRGFVITREERFLQPWNDARGAFPKRATALERLAAEDPAVLRRVRAIRQAGMSYIRDYAVPLIDAARRNDPSARSVARTGEGKRRVDALRAEFDALAETERAELTARQESADAAARRAIVYAAVGVAASVLLILLFAAYLTRAIVGPVRRAAAMAGRLAGGDLATRVPETGVGEIGALERGFNTMAGSLERNRDELARLADEQAALRRVATFVARGVPPSDVFSAVAQEVAELLGGDMTKVLRSEADGSATVVGGWSVSGMHIPLGTRLAVEPEDIAESALRTGRPARTDSFDGPPGSLADCFRRAGLSSGAASPIVVEGRLWGVVVVASAQPDGVPPVAERRLADFAELVATAIANVQARSDLAASRARIAAAADEERRRVVRDLHDGAQQRLVHT